MGMHSVFMGQGIIRPEATNYQVFLDLAQSRSHLALLQRYIRGPS